MQVAMLVSADDSVSSVSHGASDLDARLLQGARLESIEALRDLLPLIAEARRAGRAEGRLRVGPRLFAVSAMGGAQDVFVTFESAAPLSRVSLELVDVLLSGELPRVLTEVCRAAASVLPDAMCAVFLIGDDGLLRVGAAPNVPEPLLAPWRGVAPSAELGVVGQALEQKQFTVASDVAMDPRFASQREAAQQAGARQCWAWPILARSGGSLGVLVAWGRGAHRPVELEVAHTFAIVRFAALAIEHARSARATTETLERYHLVGQASTNVVYDWNLRSNTLEWSPRMQQVFGYDESHAMSLDWWESCLHPVERERVVAALQEAITERRGAWNQTYRFRRKHGTWATVVDRGHLLFDETGVPTRLIGEMSDVSGQQQLQARLALTERLASVGTLAAGVAHEINNPLAWITSNLQFAIEELGRIREESSMASLDELLEALHDARSGSVRVSTIVRDLKLFARAQDDQVAMVDVRRVLESAITMARNEIRHRASLERRFDEVPLVRGNEGKLSQVFLNLLINAAQALPEGELSRHRIVASTGVDPNGNVVVSISDTGHGIEPDLLPHIFDPFFTTKPVGQGTGLGLSICHTIVSGLGGSIQVESTLKKGTTFRVVLPVGAVEARKSPVPLVEPTVAHARGVVVLIDDEPSVLTALHRVLAGQHEVKAFTEPQEALAELPGLSPDVIFCDVMMPHMSGGELYGRLRTSHPGLAERLVFMTGGAFSPNAREALQDAQRPVLEKPFSADGVRRLVNEQVARVRATR
ncbi:MAG: PAS domain-containing protein [Myxococcaceae bacterium]|nr:PAS domain-containing protein [Myxococcaceae bacterium]